MKVFPTKLNDGKINKITLEFGDIHQFMDREHFVVDLKMGDQWM